MCEFRQHLVAEPEMLSDANFFRGFVDLLEFPVKKCDSAGGSAAGQFLLRARKQVDKLGLLGRRCPPFFEGAVDSKDIAPGVFVEPARIYPALSAYKDQTVSSSRFRARHARRDESLLRSSPYARFKWRYSENSCEHKQPNSCTCHALSGPGFAARFLILSLMASHRPVAATSPRHPQVSEIPGP